MSSNLLDFIGLKIALYPPSQRVQFKSLMEGDPNEDVVGFSNFYHDNKLKTIKLGGVPGLESVPACQGAFNMPAMHFFKIC